MPPTRQNKRTQAPSIGTLHQSPQYNLNLSYTSAPNTAQPQKSPNIHPICQQSQIGSISATTTSSVLMSSSLNTNQFHSHALSGNLLTNSCTNLLPPLNLSTPTFTNENKPQNIAPYDNNWTSPSSSSVSPTAVLSSAHKKAEFKLIAMP